MVYQFFVCIEIFFIFISFNWTAYFFHRKSKEYEILSEKKKKKCIKPHLVLNLMVEGTFEDNLSGE